MRISCLLLLFMITFQVNAQDFYGKKKGGMIVDYRGEIRRTMFPIEVNGLSDTINSVFGLEKVCFSITHKRTSDLKVELIAPDGTAIWVSNRNGRGKGIYGDTHNYANTCFTTNGFNGHIIDGFNPYKGEYSPDGLMAYLNNGQNPNGYWYLAVTDLKEGVLGRLNFVSLTFGKNPASLDVSTCSVEDATDCVSSHKDSLLLPDLVVLEDVTKSQIKYFGPEDELYPNQLRFAVAMANIGEGPLEIKGFGEWKCGDIEVDGSQKCADATYSRQVVYQYMYQVSGDTLIKVSSPAGTMYYDDQPGHDHYHVDGWTNYRLLKKRWWTNNPKHWKVVAASDKVSYCLFDTGICKNSQSNCLSDSVTYGESNLDNYGLGSYVSCFSEYQGISVGGYDFYGMYYEGQSIDLNDVDIKPSAEYYLFIQVNEDGVYQELFNNNNSVIVEVILKS